MELFLHENKLISKVHPLWLLPQPTVNFFPVKMYHSDQKAKILTHKISFLHSTSKPEILSIQLTQNCG